MKKIEVVIKGGIYKVFEEVSPFIQVKDGFLTIITGNNEYHYALDSIAYYTIEDLPDAE